MDRKEELKMAACSHWSNAPYKEEVEKGCISETAMARKIALRTFAAGAEWADAHPKNPWISVNDRLTESDDLMITGCWCSDYFKYVQRGLYDKNSGEWRDDCGNVICVTHYMPIVEPK
jgi:hypothetical protein